MPNPPHRKQCACGGTANVCLPFTRRVGGVWRASKRRGVPANAVVCQQSPWCACHSRVVWGRFGGMRLGTLGAVDNDDQSLRYGASVKLTKVDKRGCTLFRQKGVGQAGTLLKGVDQAGTLFRFESLHPACASWNTDALRRSVRHVCRQQRLRGKGGMGGGRGGKEGQHTIIIRTLSQANWTGSPRLLTYCARIWPPLPRC